jgi:hypothetical protein
MNLDSINISILHATIKENNLQSSTFVPILIKHLAYLKKKDTKPWASNDMHKWKDQNIHF